MLNKEFFTSTSLYHKINNNCIYFLICRCKLEPVMVEVDRIVRPGGKFIVRDESSVVGEVEKLLKSLHWEVHFTFSTKKEGILSAQKSDWRPESYQAAS